MPGISGAGDEVASLEPTNIYAATAATITLKLKNDATISGNDDVCIRTVCEDTACAGVGVEKDVPANGQVAITDTEFTTAGVMKLCWEAAPGTAATYVEQTGTGVELTVIAKAEAITEISPKSVVLGSTAAAAAITLTGPLIKASDEVCFDTATNPCGDGTQTTCTTSTEANPTTNLVVGANKQVTPASDDLMKVGSYTLCYQIEGANAYTKQTTTGLTFEVITAEKVVSALSPKSITQGATSDITLTGDAVATDDKVCFQKDCPAAKGLCTGTELTVKTGKKVTTTASMEVGALKLCYKAAGNSDFVAQTDLTFTVDAKGATASSAIKAVVLPMMPVAFWAMALWS